jgi:hypothetical protein
MKKWEHETIREASTGTIAGQLCDWPEVAEALTNNGMPLLGYTRMKAVKEICRLILNERKTIETTAESDEVKELQAKLLEREVYVNCHDIAEFRRGYCEAFAFIGWLSDLEEVDYIAARIGK